MNNPHNIYVHVPFCVKKCNYCAFFSHACAAPDWDDYENKIICEIKYWGQKLGKITVPTIFFGGGTPSLMPVRTFSRIMSELRQNFNTKTDTEITVESNPKTLDCIKLNDFCEIGMNRISIGVQSFDDEKLKFLGRIHSANDALNLIENAQHHKIRVSCDFIYGLPGENVDDVIKTCVAINDIGITHCSMYELTIEPNTPFGKMNLNMPTNETMAEMYMAIGKTLNMPRYEVSNYATPGAECRHNQNVWDGEPYIGIGVGAAGRIFMDNVWYEQMGGGELFQKMTNRNRAIERVITGIRTTRGVRQDSEVIKILNLEFAKSHPDMLVFHGDRISATDSGILVLDDLTQKLVK
jgi:oxygen-independent coproporphyrinogen-3 oxidase